MEVAPLPFEIPKEQISESYEIIQDDNNYKLNIKIINQDIILNVLDKKEQLKEYEIKLSLEELKQMHKVFSLFNSCQEFLNFIKLLLQNKKFFIKRKKENKLYIELIVEFLYKQNTIKIDLSQKKLSFDLSIQDLYNKISILNQNYEKLFEENKEIKKENNDMKIRIKNLEEIITKLNLDNQNKISNNINDKNILKFNSEIMEDNEFNLIKSEIEKRMNNQIKGIKKLYQATKYDGEPKIFHEKCDNISNTLILYK